MNGQCKGVVRGFKKVRLYDHMYECVLVIYPLTFDEGFLQGIVPHSLILAVLAGSLKYFDDQVAAHLFCSHSSDLIR
jgi:hypothetical protein